jgi:lipopolysaccharide export system protein LptC
MPASSALSASRQPEIDPSPGQDENTWSSLLWPDVAPTMRHSRRVALLKRVLPTTGMALLVLVAMWPRLAPLWERMRFAVPAIDLRDARELRMIHPRYAGTDRQGRPFVVTAAVGRQVPNRQDLMSLEAPRADLKTHSGADIVLTAVTGIYQAQTQLLDLFDKVTLVRQDGTSFVSDRARIDIANNTAEGSDPVVGHGPSGDVKAAGFRVLGKGDVIILTGKSDMLLRPARPVGKEAAPPSLPPAVAAAARQAAAAAAPAISRAATRPYAVAHAVAHSAATPPRAAHRPPAHVRQRAYRSG